MPILVVVTLLVFETLLVFVHLAVYGTLVAAFGVGSKALGWIFVSLALTFLTASLLTYRFKGKIVDWYYTASAYWFGLVNAFFIGGVVFFFAARFLYARDDYVSPALLGGIAFGTMFLVHTYGTWKSGRAEITSIRVSLPNLSAPWRGRKVVFVSELHLGNIRRARFAAKVAETIMALHPEAVFIGGDLYDGTACDVAAVIEPLRALRAPHGVYFITGNHEYYLPDLQNALRAIKALGIRVLDNEKVDLGGFFLVGVDDKAAHRRDDFKKVLGPLAVRSGAPAGLLKHEPSDLDIARDAGFALGLFGHTHRGQIFPLNYITRQVYRGFDYGLKRLGAMQVYTSSGVGTWGPPLRLGTKSEVVLIEFV